MATSSKESSADVSVDADVTQEGTTTRDVSVDRETDVEIHWWGADIDEGRGAPERIGREDRELKYAGDS